MVIDEQQLSELADGELSADEFCRVLVDVLDDQQSQAKLREFLRLRVLLSSWRCLDPNLVVTGTLEKPAVRNHRSRWSQLLRLCAAAMVGGVLAMAGDLLFLQKNGENIVERPPQQTNETMVVTAKQMQELAQVFAFHQSVAGPLKWYAAGADTVQLASAAESAPNGRPVAVKLRVRFAQSARFAAVTKEYEIVCREHEPAIIHLPANGSRMRVSLIPTLQDGRVHIEYAIEWEHRPDGGNVAALLGQRDVALQQTPLGQLVVGDRMVNVAASAWVLKGANL